MIRALADTRRSTPGRCCLCDAPATMWLRTGRHRSDADGLTTAARACAEHEQATRDAMDALTIADIAALVPRHRCASRARGSRSRADRMAGRGRAHSRTSAALRGASSATHTHALLGGMAEMEARALYALADALLERVASWDTFVCGWALVRAAIGSEVRL